MTQTRIGRFQERQAKKRLWLSLAGSTVLIALVVFFGVKLLINFSLVIDWLQGFGTPPSETVQTVILPPTLDALPEATNTATLKLTGKGQPKLTVIIYVNGTMVSSLPVLEDGTFTDPELPLAEGDNMVNAKSKDQTGNLSELSNTVTTRISVKQPKLEVASPQDNETITNDTGVIGITGVTDPDNTVTVNDRLAIIRETGDFSYTFRLNEGDNVISVRSTDEAGNTVTVERKVKYIR